MLRLALHLAPDAATGEDLVQQVYLTLLQDGDDYDPARPLLPWLLGVLGNHARNAQRAKRRWPRS